MKRKHFETLGIRKDKCGKDGTMNDDNLVTKDFEDSLYKYVFDLVMKMPKFMRAIQVKYSFYVLAKQNKIMYEKHSLINEELENKSSNLKSKFPCFMLILQKDKFLACDNYTCTFLTSAVSYKKGVENL